ncbi:hypothetical protein [Arenibaculum pallidiluteum]|uniref:hypothetical protein n=1 Tax=Arenibaculum pallidiluteum TaxID=2812559 RepID=UPI001A965F94|nr:hypothetical protein [Arenibaculum pallidiluteum]
MQRSRRDRERSKRIRKGVLKLALAAAVLGSASYYAYDTGRQVSANEAAAAKAEAQRLAEAGHQQAEEQAELRASLAEAQASAAQYRQRYDEVAPAAVREILARAQAKLAEGVPAERIAFFVAQAQEARDCAPVDTRRLIVRTENYDGANTWVRFDDIVTVSAAGAAAEDGRAGWFDPAKPVTVAFAPLGGPRQEISGKLPLHHAFVYKSKEYRFAAVPGRRGFMEVSADWCEHSLTEERHAARGG